jgi:hypothetical protein
MMKYSSLQKAPEYQVQAWLEKSIPNLTAHQKEAIRVNEIIRWAPFNFYQEKKVVTNVWWRLSVIFHAPLFVLLLVGLPIHFLLTGRWGYSYKWLRFLDTWRAKIGL